MGKPVAAGALQCSGFGDAADLDKGGSSGPVDMVNEKGLQVEYLFRMESTGFCMGWAWREGGVRVLAL